MKLSKHRLSCYLIYCFWSMLLLPKQALATIDTIQIGDSFSQNILLKKNLEYHHTKDKIDTIKCLSSLERIDTLEKINILESIPFKPLNENLYFGLTDKSFWGRFVIQNKGEKTQELALEITNPNFTNVFLYQKNKDKLEIECLGTALKFDDRWHRNIIFNITLKPNQVKECFLHIRPSKYPSNFDLYLSTKSYKKEIIKSENGIILIFLGLCFTFLALLTFALYIIRLRYFWYYILYVLFGVLFILTDQGFSFQYLWPNHPLFQQIAISLIPNLYLITGIIFVQYFFNTKQSYTLIHDFFQRLIYMVILFIPINILMLFIQDIKITRLITFFHYFIYVLTCLFLFYLFFLSLKRKHDIFPGLFLLAFSLHGLSIIAVILQYIDLLPNRLFPSIAKDIPPIATYIDDFPMMIGMLIEIAIIIYLLARRFRFFYKARFATLRKVATQKQQTMYDLADGIEMERQRIGEDLHDQIATPLAAMKMQLQSFESPQNENRTSKQKHLIALVDRLNVDVRNIIKDNNTFAVIQQEGYIPAIKQLMLRTKSMAPQIRIKPLFNNFPFEQTTEISQISIYRIVQELLNNIVKHSEATEVIIQFTKQKEGLLFSIHDNGKGYDIDSVKKGVGLNSIQRRIDALSGKQTIESNQNNGTFVSIEIPNDSLFEESTDQI